MKRFAAFTIAVSVAAGAHAATFTVTNTNDSGPGSLRDAVAQANANTEENTINFAVTGTITLTTGELLLSRGPLTIIGPGADQLAVDGNAAGRMFIIRDVAPFTCPASGTDYLVTISRLTLQNGLRANDTAGGAIQAFKSLALDSVVVKNNVARGGGGVGFFVQYPGQSLTIGNTQFLGNSARPAPGVAIANNSNGGALLATENCPFTRPSIPVTATISNSVFIGNRAEPVLLTGRGGAIHMSMFADAVISDSRIVDNHVQPPPSPPQNTAYVGGGIEGYVRSMRIERTEITQNSARDGAGIRLFNTYLELQAPQFAANLEIINSTISNNAASSSGGALTLLGNIAARIYNSTLVENTSRVQFTSGIQITTTGTAPPATPPINAAVPTLKLVSSIVANQTVNAADIGISFDNVPAPYVVDATDSLVQGPGTGVAVSRATNILGTVPYLGPLAFNGGTTRTKAPLPTSVVIDRGSNPLGLATDQRGPGYTRVLKTRPDIGAYESDLPFLPGLGFAPPATYPATRPLLRAAVDLTGDGTIDLVSLNAPGSGIDVLINNGDGTFTSRSYPVGGQPSAMATCDVDGDALRDLVVVSTGSNTMSVLLNQRDGTFRLSQTLPAGVGPAAVTCQANTTSPLSHNVFLVNSGDSTLMQYQDDGVGNFSLRATVPVGADPRSIVTGDFDLNNYRDHVTVNFASSSVTVAMQSAGPTYTTTAHAVGAGPVNVTLTDVNGDGLADIVTDNATANSVSVLINLEGGVFSSAVHYAVGANPRQHATADFDGDGQLDLAVRNAGSNDIAILLNRGDGSYASAVFYPVGGSPTSINSSDFDSDGNPDVVVVVPSLNAVAVLYGNPDGTFRPAVIIPVGAGPTSTVQVADLNGDARPDLAVPLQGEDKVAVLFNATDFVLGPSTRNNYQGLWWKAPAGSESGWGLSIAHQGDTLFVTWLTYGADRQPVWYSATLQRTSANVYTGALVRSTGPSFQSASFDPAQVTRTTVGTMSITFFGNDNGYFAYTVGSVSQAKTITRQVFATPVPVCAAGALPDLALARNYQDNWVSSAEAGWALGLAHQGRTIVGTWATYGPDGRPTWFAAVTEQTGVNIFAGPVLSSTGPAFDAMPWDSATVASTTVGNATLAFADGKTGVFDYTVGGRSQTKQITRQVFASPATACF